MLRVKMEGRLAGGASGLDSPELLDMLGGEIDVDVDVAAGGGGGGGFRAGRPRGAAG